MKDYEHIVIWLDYFNKTLTRNKGRRLSKEKCIFDPSLKELIDATKAAVQNQQKQKVKLDFQKDHMLDQDTLYLKKNQLKQV